LSAGVVDESEWTAKGDDGYFTGLRAANRLAREAELNAKEKLEYEVNKTDMYTLTSEREVRVVARSKAVAADAAAQFEILVQRRQKEEMERKVLS
jgi:hypothetical protein